MAVTVAVAVLEVSVVAPAKIFAVATGESTMAALSRSAWVTVYVAVQAVLTPGARVVAAHEGGASRFLAGAAWVSETFTRLTVTLVLLVTTNVYVTLWPTAETVAGEGDLVRARLPVCVTPTVADPGEDVTAGPSDGVPVAMAVSFMDPLSRSACVAGRWQYRSCSPPARAWWPGKWAGH